MSFIFDDFQSEYPVGEIFVIHVTQPSLLEYIHFDNSYIQEVSKWHIFSKSLFFAENLPKSQRC